MYLYVTLKAVSMVLNVLSCAVYLLHFPGNRELLLQLIIMTGSNNTIRCVSLLLRTVNPCSAD